VRAIRPRLGRDALRRSRRARRRWRSSAMTPTHHRTPSRTPHDGPAPRALWAGARW
jgi:hypothetical protein